MIVLVLAVVLFFAITPESRAENYVAGYLGIAVPHESDTDFIVTGIGTFTGKVGFDAGFAIGGKMGTRIPLSDSPSFWGIELDVNAHFPDYTELIYAGYKYPAKGDVSVLFVTGNVLLGYQGEAFQPYAGGGIGLARADVELKTVDGVPINNKADDTALGWQILAGMDLPINPRLSFFVEYRYAGANVELVFPGETDEVNYRTSLFYGGLRHRF